MDYDFENCLQITVLVIGIIRNTIMWVKKFVQQLCQTSPSLYCDNFRHGYSSVKFLSAAYFIFIFFINCDKMLQLSQSDRAAACVSFGQKWKTGTGRQYFTNIIDLQPLWQWRCEISSNNIKKNYRKKLQEHHKNIAIQHWIKNSSMTALTDIAHLSMLP